MPSKATINTALVALAAVALCAFVQTQFMQIPVVGPYLPGGQASGF
jgi:hypothetical protein